MDTIRIMSVGRSGVGKSTIGNMFLHGKCKGSFNTSTGSTCCTEMPMRLGNEKGDVEYIDVPGIPSTDPKSTAKFYDILVSEANKGVDVILFVFKRDKEDPEAYKSAGVLFREMNKCSAVKILVINDFNNYDFDDPPTEADFEGQMARIETLTKINFTHRMTLNSKTMPIKVNAVKDLISAKRESEHLRNLTEQAWYVKKLQENLMHHRHEIRIEEERFSYYKTVGPISKYAAIIFGSVSGLSAIASLVTGGAFRPFTAASLALAGGLASLHQKQITNLSEAEDKISVLKRQNITNDSQTANQEFKELKKVLETSCE